MRNFETIADYCFKNNYLTVVRETEKAVLVNVPGEYDHVRETCSEQVWLPKSRIEISEEGKVVKMADWLAKKNGIPTEEAEKVAEGRREAALDRYADLVAKAKAAGLPVRNRMKTATILKIAKDHGVAL